MPDWQPVAVPDLCPRCGAYWECECPVVSQEAAKAKFIPEVMTRETVGGASLDDVITELNTLAGQWLRERDAS